jgi:hypothetical protein
MTGQVPNGGITPGEVWTTPQWITAWQSKADDASVLTAAIVPFTTPVIVPVIQGGAGKAASISAVFGQGNQTPVAGSLMQIDNLIESSPDYPLANEGSIWPQTTYSYAAFSKEFNAFAGAGGSPLATLFAFANNNNSGGDVTAIIGDAVDRTGSSTVFGGNLIARNGAGISGSKLVGLEIDVEPAAGTTPSSNSCGLIFNIYNVAAADPTPVCTVGGVGGGIWGNGFLTSHIAGAHFAVQSGDPVQAHSFINTTNASSGFISAAIVLGQGAAQSIDFGGSAFGTSPYVYGDSSGNLNFNAGTGGLLALRNTSGSLTSTWSAITGVKNLAGTSPALQVAGTQVVGAQQTTAVAAAAFVQVDTTTAVSTDSTFDGYTLKQVVKALRLHGLLQ